MINTDEGFVSDMTVTTGLLRAIGRGKVAAAVGTLAMDALWYARYRRGGGQDGFVDWEFSASTVGFDEAGAPAQVGQRVLWAVTGRELPERLAGVTKNVVHWATGAQWGALYGAVAWWRGTDRPALGLALGPLAWATSYAALGSAGIYQPIWRYDAPTVAKDLSAHMVFGLATATAYRALARA